MITETHNLLIPNKLNTTEHNLNLFIASALQSAK